MPYYAVAKGRKPGIYTTWNECSIQVLRFPGSIYKRFATESEAQEFIKESSTVGKSLTKNLYLRIGKSVKSQARKHAFPLGSIQSTTVQTKLLSPHSKRTFSVDSDTSKQPTKKRKITSDDDNKMDFIVDKEGYVNVFTDGACSFNGCKNARAGIGIWFQDNHPLNVSQPVEGRPTNNMAEIQAVTVAARQAKKAGIKKLKINTDSKFLISCITQWIPNWKKRGWKTMDNKPVINKTELLEMETELESLTIAWNHVNGHAGIYGNEMADKLARKGSLLYKSDNKDKHLS